MELFANQVLAGIATGAIYACMALAVVMIYQAIDHLNFAQGEMAMFSTFVSWQLMQWGVPYWGAFVLTVAFSFAAGIVIERLLFKPLAKAPILTNVAGFIALYAIINSVAGLIWDFTIKQYPTPFGSSPFLGSQLISTHQAGMIGITLLMLLLLFFFRRRDQNIEIAVKLLGVVASTIAVVKYDLLVSLVVRILGSGASELLVALLIVLAVLAVVILLFPYLRRVFLGTEPREGRGGARGEPQLGQ